MADTRRQRLSIRSPFPSSATGWMLAPAVASALAVRSNLCAGGHESEGSRARAYVSV